MEDGEVGDYTGRGRDYSQILLLKPRVVAFSLTPRLMWSGTPAGYSA